MTHFINFSFDWVSVMVWMVILGGIGLVLKSSKNWLILLRCGAFAVILWLIMEPSVATVSRPSEKPALAVLVDVSRSMGIEDPEERLNVVKKILKNSESFLKEKFDLSYYQFSQSCTQTTLKNLLKAKPYGAETNIVEAIRQVNSEKKQEHPAILLFSDGTCPMDEEKQSLSAFDFPVYSVGIGGEKNIFDIAVKEVRGADFAFKNRSIEVTAKITHLGFSNRKIPVLLKERRNGQLSEIGIKEINLDTSSGETEVVFKFVPATVGSLDYRIEVPVQNGEIAKENNGMDFHLEVGREKIRVLYICGQPNPEYAFLRQLLKSDPSSDLVSFVILRNPENVVPVTEEQLSLIPFPSHDIFVTTLNEFDLLIFENFSYTRLGILPSHLDNIRRFVEQRGGGFLMIGGENSFGLGGYQGTAIEPILPVTLNPAFEKVEEDDVSLKVLEMRHPVMNIGETLQETEKFWKNIPKLNGVHKVTGIKNGATLLVTNQSNGLPVIACWQKGKGRVAAISALSTWQWALNLSEQGLLISPYAQFWRQMIRWLISSVETEPVRIIFNRSQCSVGQKTMVRCIVQLEKQKSASLDVQLNISRHGKIIQVLPLAAVGKLDYRAEWNPSEEGTYLISAVVKDGLKKYEDHRSLEVKSIDFELENPYPDHPFLKEISERSGGQYFDAEEFLPQSLNGKMKAVQGSSVNQIQKEMWTNPWFFSVLIGLLLLEWTINRYRGEI